MKNKLLTSLMMIFCLTVTLSVSALAFDKDGALYITVFGTGENTGDKPTGGMIRLEPGL